MRGETCEIIPFLHGELVLKAGYGHFLVAHSGPHCRALAKFIMPGKDPGGFFVTILIGIAGAIVGGFLGSFIGLGKVSRSTSAGFSSHIGAILLLIVYRFLRKKS